MSAVAPLLDLGPAAAAPVGRRTGDFYPTPAELVMAIAPHLPRFQVACDLGCGDGAILDALADIESYRENLQTTGVELDQALADRAASKLHQVWIADLLKDPRAIIPRAEGRAGHASSIRAICRDADIICMNPPFEHAEHFIRVALEHRHPCATVAALLRLSFVESAERVALHRAYPDGDMYVIPNRVDFTRGAVRVCPRCDGTKEDPKPRAVKPGSKVPPGRCGRCAGKGWVKGGNDTSVTCWFVWGPGRTGRRHTLDPVAVPDIVGCSEMLEVGGSSYPCELEAEHGGACRGGPRR